MSRGIDARLRKLEAVTASRETHFFVIEGDTRAERQAQVDGLLTAGIADSSDSFIHTGVKRSPGSPFFCGTANALFADIAANGRRIFNTPPGT
jgi:hypothetical protein